MSPYDDAIPSPSEPRLPIDTWFDRPAMPWLRPAAGLGAYGDGFRALMLIVTLGYALVLVAAALHSARLSPAIGAVVPLVSVAIIVAMAVGAGRFSRRPSTRAWARSAFVLLVVAALAEAYAEILALHVVGIGLVPPSLDASANGLFSAVKNLPGALAVAQVGTLLSLPAMLLGCERAARSLVVPDVAERATRALPWAITAAILVGAVHLADARLARPDVVVLGGLAALLVAIIAAARGLGVTRYFQAYLRGLGVPRDSDASAPLAAWRDA